MSSGSLVARHHVRVGHARHGNVLITFAGGRCRVVAVVQQAARQLVRQVAAQHAVLDQHILLRGHALVVDIQRSAPVLNRAVVDDGAKLAGHLLPDAAAERRDTLAIEVGFKPMPHCFVQQDSRPSGTEHHGHLASRRGDASSCTIA